MKIEELTEQLLAKVYLLSVSWPGPIKICLVLMRTFIFILCCMKTR